METGDSSSTTNSRKNSKEETIENNCKQEISKDERTKSSESNKSSQSKKSSSSQNTNNTDSQDSNQRTTSQETTSSNTDNDESSPQTSTNWWGLISSVATDVSAAVVQGVKEEIQEIREDIETVASASVTAGQQIAEYSAVVGEKAKVSAIKAADASSEFLKTDLKEFGKVLGEETNETVKDVKEVSSIIGGTLSGWVGNFSNMVASSSLVSSNSYYEDYDQSGIIIGKNKQKINFVSAFEARLHNLKTDTATYCVHPEDESDYELWRETFDLDSSSTKTTISDLLVASQEVRSLYTKLVPSAVAHQEFWQRYFYKLDALERAERRRNAIMERAGKSEELDEEDLSWGGDSDPEESHEKSNEKVTKKVSISKAENVSNKSINRNPSVDIDVNNKTASTKENHEKDPKSDISDSPVIVKKDENNENNKNQNVDEEDDWEKEFDIDMTEAEIQAALNDEGSDNLDDWD